MDETEVNDIMQRVYAEHLIKKMMNDTTQENPLENEISDDRIADDLRDVFAISKMKICTAADKIATGEFDESLPMVSDSTDTIIPYPDDRKWDLALGNRVRIACSLQEFKRIQKAVLGWKKSLKNLFGYEGIVTGFANQYKNDVEIYFPEILTSTQLYPGVLKVVSGNDESTERSQWKIGQSVTTMADENIAHFFQIQLPEIPSKYLAKRGRVIAVTSVGVFVTFDEKKSYAINPALLIPGDNAPKYEKKKEENENFSVGEEVLVNSNLEALMENQKDFGDWEPDMCSLAGKKVTIVSIRKDGRLFVQMPGRRMWGLDPKSVKKLEKIQDIDQDDMPEITGEGLEFLPGDRVKFKILPNMKMLLASKGIDLVFLEYLRETFLVESLMGPKELVLKLYAIPGLTVWFSGKLLRKASSVECEAYANIQSKVVSLKAGNRVCFDLGPPNYVRTILREMKSPPHVIKTLTTFAILIGFTDADHAVIEYESGKKYRINKKFLTVPEKFDLGIGKESMLSPSMISMVMEAIVNCVEIIDKKGAVSDPKSDVDLISVTRGDPPSINFDITSIEATAEKVIENMKEKTGWRVEELDTSHFLIQTEEDEKVQPVKLALTFNGERNRDMHRYLDWTEDERTAVVPIADSQVVDPPPHSHLRDLWPFFGGTGYVGFSPGQPGHMPRGNYLVNVNVYGPAVIQQNFYGNERGYPGGN